MELRTDQPLRILALVNLPWDPRLGAARVWIELAEEWRAAGHVVEKFCLTDAFPTPTSSRGLSALRQAIFPARAADFVRHNAGRFDVIDCLIGTLPFNKNRLRFHGLLVARSVGFYRTYDNFNRRSAEHSPLKPRGKLIGRIFYSFTRRHLLNTSRKSILHADLVNLPNADEIAALHEEVGAGKPAIVQPYGLTNERRGGLRHSAATPEVRRAQRKVCFIGMWSARKGAGDWLAIVRKVRARVPDATFLFLGTMTEEQLVRNALDPAAQRAVEIVPEYDPAQLPRLLAHCTVGAFPSYLEGFGLAVIEQLAAGIPTVAYAVSGPRQILSAGLGEFLVPPGDVDAFAAVICRILENNLPAYQALCDRAAAVASHYSWPAIAEETLSLYREHLTKSGPRAIAFVQPFSLGSAGGGPRILRALLENAPHRWFSICTSPWKLKKWPNEIHLPSRASWGPFEHSRLAFLPRASSPIFAPGFRRKLKKLCQRKSVCAIHAVPHSGVDFSQAQDVAEALQIPFCLSIHDDLRYTSPGVSSGRSRDAAMRRAWLKANARFVISDRLGLEYSRRYGARDYIIVTDGLEQIAAAAASPRPSFRVYFMGLFHMPYERNLRALLDALTIVQGAPADCEVSVTCRCEHIRPHVLAGGISVSVLPFTSEEEIWREIQQADFLYMPLPFGETHENFARYSLSTKMVTYLGSGVPILYHGPTNSAAFDLLDEYGAAIFATNLEPREIAQTLSATDAATRAKVATNALRLARDHFMLADQKKKFWGKVAELLPR